MKSFAFSCAGPLPFSWQRFALVPVVWCLLLVGTSEAARTIAVTRLRCEYAQNPLGIDVPAPRLGWELESRRRDQRQTAYRILVASSEVKLKADEGDLWDSDKVISDRSTHIVYAGKPLVARQRCWWKVCVWDKDGRLSSWSLPARWEMGLLKPGDWQATWIGLEQSWPGQTE